MRYIEDVSEETKRLLTRIYHQSRHHRTRQRAHAILLSHQGYTARQLQEIFQTDRLTIYHWFDAWEARKCAGLYDRPGKGAKPKLTQEQQTQVKAWAQEFPRQLTKVRALVKAQWGKAVSKKTLSRVLHRLKMSWRRVRRQVKGTPDADEYAQKRQALEQLGQQEARGEIDLRYLDQSGFCLTPYVPYAWQLQGQTIEVPATSHSTRLNVVGFLNRANELEAYTFEESIDSAVMIACIEAFCCAVTKRTVLVCDQASIHTSAAFRDRIPAWKKRGVEIFYLPPYSPELNLIEILWRFIKYTWLEFSAYVSWSQLVESVESILCQVGIKYKINFV